MKLLARSAIKGTAFYKLYWRERTFTAVEVRDLEPGIR